LLALDFTDVLEVTGHMGVQELRTNHLRQMAVVLPSSLGVLTATVLRFGFGLADLLLVQRGRCLPSAELLGAEVLPCMHCAEKGVLGRFKSQPSPVQISNRHWFSKEVALTFHAAHFRQEFRSRMVFDSLRDDR